MIYSQTSVDEERKKSKKYLGPNKQEFDWIDEEEGGRGKTTKTVTGNYVTWKRNAHQGTAGGLGGGGEVEGAWQFLDYTKHLVWLS